MDTNKNKVTVILETIFPLLKMKQRVYFTKENGAQHLCHTPVEDLVSPPIAEAKKVEGLRKRLLGGTARQRPRSARRGSPRARCRRPDRRPRTAQGRREGPNRRRM